MVLFGGTFDPVHLGHVAVAVDAARALGAPVHLMPSMLPPHRATPGVPADERRHMLELAVAAHPELTVDARELRRQGPSWTVETLRALRREEGVTRPVILLIGADAFASFDRWRDWREILELCHIVVLTRPGAGGDWSEALQAEVGARRVDELAALRERPAGSVAELAVTPLQVSSTEVRQRLAAGAASSDLLPQAVANYIDSRGLYRRC